ncbi:hypothetical protein CBFG_05779 [Clostridiales bacterium 1_7_47FAA]|nr:hypothetical protein CBFG_05779 [Clostridiales bacterium 1_7_47FAA]
MDFNTKTVRKHALTPHIAHSIIKDTYRKDNAYGTEQNRRD